MSDFLFCSIETGYRAAVVVRTQPGVAGPEFAGTERRVCLYGVDGTHKSVQVHAIEAPGGKVLFFNFLYFVHVIAPELFNRIATNQNGLFVA